MKSRVFGNSPSPAVATYGLRKASSISDPCVQEFVNNNFYVDDGLISLPSASEAVNLMKKTQATLRENGHIRLHKIASNSVDFMEAFLMDDLEKNLKNFKVCETLPVQHNLGMSWDLNKDMFVFQIADNEKPLTKRRLLSTMKSLFDSLGFISPVTISGKIFQRELVPSGSDWNEPLSNDINKWRSWLDALQSMNGYHGPRMIVPTSVSTAHHVDVHVFSDASEQTIAAVAYLRVICESGDSTIGFLMGKSKLAPLKGHTMPRLELCGAVLATEVGEAISSYLSISLDRFHYYMDSKVVLGYISNTTRRFFMYVSNRVEKIHRISSPSQWSYASTDRNPADAATRHSNALDSSVNRWISGPEWLKHVSDETMAETFPLISPECDIEIRQEVVSMKTKLSINSLEPRFVRFDKWETLVKAILVLKIFILNRLKKN
ncbi:uncharacterized protein LOC130051563 [Ostrea edulis]|uniref:uncharacterized protein LOC130051563 n=1 Tax=Ostrea edulis TaxID=37623 RepID=UPI0024AF5535|nr:uncharacterized protein LOC130051563 [Ostrea edulis]